MRCAFVSTNSITQGEQVGLLWPLLLSKGVRIHFAHRTFQWSSEARGQAAVHCVIIGFGLHDSERKLIFDYANPKAEPSIVEARNINPYLVDAPDVLLSNRSEPICNVPRMSWGNKPADGGHLILSPEERATLLKREPNAAKFIRRYMSGGDFIKGDERWCLWLVDASPQELKALPLVMARVEAVRAARLASSAASTRDYAQYPTRFRQIAQPATDYLAIPEVSSEQRSYIPIAFLSREVICSNKIQFVPAAKHYHFGVLTSAMHMAWVRAVCGRLESRLSYSNTIVYNNFPWPELELEPLSRRETTNGSPQGRGRGEGSVLRSAPAQSSTAHSPPLPQDARAFARDLRRHGSDAEQQLWFLLRDRRLGGFKFRRQHPLPPYTLDFYCHDACLCVEVDGGQHADDVTRDTRRDAALAAAGVRTLRVWADAVLREPEAVLQAIWDALHDKDARREAEPPRQPEPSPPAPLPAGEGSNKHLTGNGEGSNKHRLAIEAAAQAVLDARARFPGSTLADLYDPLTMPPALVQAHRTLDRAVDAAYSAAEKAAGRKSPKLGSDAERVAFLFERYQALTSLLPAAKAKPGRRRTPASLSKEPD